MTYRKKLIEVAMPLESINESSAYDKLPGIGPHPKGLHQWWARLPLPAARAILFASLVDDPSADPYFSDKGTKAQDEERERLFDIIRELLKKKPHMHPKRFKAAYKEIARCTDGNVPVILDPFAGGGSIPLESLRLGLKSIAGDLNPIAVMINKAQQEILPRFAQSPAVNPLQRERTLGGQWENARGLADDVRYYSKWIQSEAKKRTAHLYPQIRLSREHGSRDAIVLAWIWARTVKCPNPSCGVQMPLIRSFVLSTKKGRKTWIEPVVHRNNPPYQISFVVKTGKGKPVKGTVSRRGASCIACGAPVALSYVRTQGQHGRISERLMSIVAQGIRGKIYVSPTSEHEKVAEMIAPIEILQSDLPDQALGFRVQNYGLTKHRDLYTPRQLTTLAVILDLIQQVRVNALHEAKDCMDLQLEEDLPLNQGGNGPTAYTDALTIFLAFGLDRAADFNNALCRWNPSNEKVMNLFSRQAIPMVWDHGEANILAESVGGWLTCSNYVADCIEVTLIGGERAGNAIQLDARNISISESNFVLSTDPPYYDNIGYADLSDFFYVWLRRTAHKIYPELFSTLLVPKIAELVAAPERFDNDAEEARKHFEDGFTQVFSTVRKKIDRRYPMTLYYAFKQEDVSSQEENLRSSTGWETLLEALISSGFQITSTWPVNAAQAWRMRSMGSNALATYIVLSCRERNESALMATRRDLLTNLKKELPQALNHLQKTNIAPVDFAQASIGPGMAIFSHYARVIEADGSPMSVRTALALINQTLDEYLSEQEGEFDSDTRWAVAWFEQFGFKEGSFGDAETLSKAKNTSVSGMVQAGILKSSGGKVRLLRREELAEDWDPTSDRRLTVWEVTQHLIRTMQEEGEGAAAELRAKVGPLADAAHDLAYRLYTICERKGWAQEAMPYNSLVVAWSDIGLLTRDVAVEPVQGQLL